MMYVEPNYPTKKALKAAVKEGRDVTVFQPGLGTVPTGEAEVSVEGPHFPKPHTWCARVRIRDGRVTKVVS
jgi:hypothetical protein